MASHRTDVVKVPLPYGIQAGAIVGRGGHNCRWLHFNSRGAHIAVNDTAISIRSKDCHALNRAVQLVRRQLEAMIKLATHDTNANARVDYILLESAFGVDPRVRFSPRKDEAATVTGLKDKLFQLVPQNFGTVTSERDYNKDNGMDTRTGQARPHDAGLCTRQEGTLVTCASSGCFSRSYKPTPGSLMRHRYISSSGVSRDSEEERDQDLASGDRGLPDCWSRVSEEVGDDAGGTTRFHASMGDRPGDLVGTKRCGSDPLLLAAVGRGLAAAAYKATCREPSFDAVKMRFKLGKSLFRNVGARAEKAELSVVELEGAGSGRGSYQAVFSNWVPSSAVPRITSWLTGAMGFSLTDTKTTASLHVINQELNVHYSIALAMDRGDESTASVRKVKLGGSRSQSVSLMAAPHQMDLRLKLVTQFREHPAFAYDTDALSTARRVAAAVRTEGFNGFLRSKRGLPRNRHLEYGRLKTKLVYEGRLPYGGPYGTRVRVSVTQVQDDRGSHFEISGCLPDVNLKLQQLLRTQNHHQSEPQVPQLHQRPASPPAASPTDDIVPEWRRRGRTCSGGGGSGSSSGCGSGSSSGQYRQYSSVGSSPSSLSLGTGSQPPSPTPAPLIASTSDLGSDLSDSQQWAFDALAALEDFITTLNRHLLEVDTEVGAAAAGTYGSSASGSF